MREMDLVNFANFNQFSGGVIVMTDSKPGETKSLIELKARKTVASPAPMTAAQAGASTDTVMRDAGLSALLGSGGALAGAGVLNAVDEDEDGEEAPVPNPFDVEDEEEE